MATKKDAKKNETKLEQPTAPAVPVTPDDDALTGEDVKQGHEAWLARKPAIEARAAVGGSLPSINYPIALRTIRDTLPKLTPHLPAALKRLSDDEQAAARAGAADVLVTAQAARFVASQLSATRVVSKSTSSQQKKDTKSELASLRSTAFDHLTIAVALGHIQPATFDQLRAGQGIQDNAEDVERAAIILKELWPVLEPLQAHQKDPKKRLTLDQLNHMITFAGQLLSEIKLQSALLPGLLGVDWRKNMLGAGLLLDDQWSALIDALHHHARRSKNPDLLALLKPLRGMRG